MAWRHCGVWRRRTSPSKRPSAYVVYVPRSLRASVHCRNKKLRIIGLRKQIFCDVHISIQTHNDDDETTTIPTTEVIIECRSITLFLNWRKATLSEGNSHNGLHWEMVNTSTRSGQFAKCGTHCQDSNPPVKMPAFAISNLLQICPSYLEALECVHYKRGERFASHHYYRLHDGWKQSMKLVFFF